MAKPVSSPPRYGPEVPGRIRDITLVFLFSKSRLFLCKGFDIIISCWKREADSSWSSQALSESGRLTGATLQLHFSYDIISNFQSLESVGKTQRLIFNLTCLFRQYFSVLHAHYITLYTLNIKLTSVISVALNHLKK